jgi:hypothetical protein
MTRILRITADYIRVNPFNPCYPRSVLSVIQIRFINRKHNNTRCSII